MKIGSRDVEGHPYDFVYNIFEDLKNKRNEHDERQDPEVIASLICKIIEEKKPSLRYQTSSSSEEKVYRKLRDLSGDSYFYYYSKWLKDYLDGKWCDDPIQNNGQDWIDFP